MLRAILVPFVFTLVTAYTESWKCGFENVPMVYMNLDNQVERRMRLTEMFPEAIRIRSVDGRNSTELLSRLDYDFNAEEFSNGQLISATKNHFKAFPGEVGCCLTMFDAFKYGVEQGYEYMILAEDDVAVPLCQILPSTLDRIINQLNEADPDWEVLRLQWSVPAHSLYKMKVSQFDRLRKLVQEFGEEYRQSLMATYGAWEYAPIIGRFSGGWGTVFNVWHRRAMEKFIQKYGGRTVNGVQKWKCPDDKA
ncbi:LPS glycosyltransferase [Gregarina niphandrodes]|uniref:LPS glycosyltransferase n=1 Tax=Gregarina niphandrodes TaxID=110365 RepID=A0A023AZ87_GRENI|nr:LPS glycosyltransferase [Gregarina niphandrodes]EZG43942.1 LPS glycosyltransferase [Gregarina niphandrodes]|eukprot:XP_011132913.1 LPS glycosyltransferase [Gregarina niphandrodes]